MIHLDRVLELLHTAMAYTSSFLEGGVEIVFDLAVSILVIVLLWEGVKYLKRH